MEARARTGATLIGVGVLGTVAALSHDSTAGAILAAGASVAAVGVIAGIARTRAAGRLDLFHPLLFPSIYVAIGSLAPVAWMWLTGQGLGFIQLSSMSARTPLLMALAVAGFVVGAAVPFGPARPKGKRMDPAVLGAAGRWLLLLPLGLALLDYRHAMVLTRGQGQNVFTIADMLNAAGFIAAPAAVTMVLASRVQRDKRLLGLVDAAAILTLVGLLGLNGRRGAALAVMVVVLVFATRRKGANLRALLGLAAIAAFAYVVVTYRTAATGGRNTLDAAQVMLRDLGSVAFTTGGTDLALQGQAHYGGSSIVAGLIRQIPSPIANQILGPPVDTGTYLFRKLTGLTNGSQGYGYSLPAEGVLNFGLVGAFLVPAVAGVLLAWLYGRFDVHGSRALTLIYPVAVGSVPFAWRSDTLGAVKGVLYPALMLWAVIVVARTFAATNERLARDRAPARRPTARV